MTIQEVKALFAKAAGVVIDNEHALCAIDAETGDGDHGVAIARVAKAVIEVSRDENISHLNAFFSELCSNIMSINGGSCIPLCANIFDGMAEAVEDVEDAVAPEQMKAAFTGALEGIHFISNAKPGDKTMLDALAPAVEAANACDGDEKAILSAAAAAAKRGSDATRDMVAKFGRAKDLKEDSLGHLDAGSASISLFINALNDFYGKA